MPEQNRHLVSKKSFHKLKRTKIIATIGPSTDSYETILELIKSGTDALRLNFSHGKEEERTRQIKWIRKAASECSKTVAIIQDLQGPKIRLGDFDGFIAVTKGQTLSFSFANQDPRFIPVQYDISRVVKRGERLFLYDGKISTTISSVQNGIVHVRAENDGILIKRKGINLPDSDFDSDIITEQDKKHITYGSTHDIDYVALSFVQSSRDIEQLRRILKNLGSQAKIIAKIETKAAVENLESIVLAADALMIARGDLAIETPLESVPITQRKIIGLGQRHAKPTIVATQLLASMTDTPEPTRAEVSDVATSVLIGADCLMLSDETASGRYPIQSVAIMDRIVRHTETHAPLKTVFPDLEEHTKQSAISSAIIDLAANIQAKTIIAETRSGATVLQIARYRSDTPLTAVTNDIRVAQQLSIVFGVRSYVRPAAHQSAMKLTSWLQSNKVLSKGDVVLIVSGQHPGVVGTTDTIRVRVLE